MKQPLTWVSYTYAGPRVSPKSGFCYLFSSITMEVRFGWVIKCCAFIWMQFRIQTQTTVLIWLIYLGWRAPKLEEAHNLFELLIYRNRESYGFQQLEINSFALRRQLQPSKSRWHLLLTWNSKRMLSIYLDFKKEMHALCNILITILWCKNGFCFYEMMFINKGISITW